MTRTISRIAAVALVAGLGMTGVAEAKTYKVNMVLKGSLSGTTITGTAKGIPFGNCKNKASLVIPKTKGTWTCPKGKVFIVGVGTTGAANEARGTWKITGGTGKFKGAKGKGTFSGLQSTGKFTYKGKVSF